MIGFITSVASAGSLRCQTQQVCSSQTRNGFIVPTNKSCTLHTPIRRATIQMNEGTINKELLKTSEDRMKKSIDAVGSAFNTVRTGRANPSVLDRVMVSYYGAETPLKSLASVSVPSSSVIQIDPFDRAAIKDIERAIMDSDLGLTPQNDGSCIRLMVPSLTQERRKEFVKQVKNMAEEARVAIRNIRRDAVDKLKKLEKDSEISKDESKVGQEQIQKLTDKYTGMVDKALETKEKEIMKV
eukprot:CAMPEP_0184703614 /NCGR_PEP_ID=MMETSP0313-20130426/28468_1 /TAXON_ID=2792 /ORGANISM="Porphyridium aerugineum, Strain SAG 1380-2" /LENGTH=240 /DNA_ID=CAMNT_0027164429 /DNA_START=93 /DNA_END=815 /DNA_ORIENTATION=+